VIASRGMGDINPSKMPGAKKKARRDNTDFTQYAEGGKVWGSPNPAKKQQLKQRAAPAPNSIDNMRMAK